MKCQTNTKVRAFQNLLIQYLEFGSINWKFPEEKKVYTLLKTWYKVHLSSNCEKKKFPIKTPSKHKERIRKN